MALCGGTVDDYDDLEGSVGHSSCDLPARSTGTIHTVMGHMHEFGAAYRMTLHPDTPEERILLDIPVWDFEWQLNYEPVEDIRIERGDMVRFECWWDPHPAVYARAPLHHLERGHRRRDVLLQHLGAAGLTIR